MKQWAYIYEVAVDRYEDEAFAKALTVSSEMRLEQEKPELRVVGVDSVRWARTQELLRFATDEDGNQYERPVALRIVFNVEER